MTYKTHIAGGLLLAGALQHIPAFHHPETTHIGLLAVTAISALLPDIDHSRSFLANRNLFVKVFGAFVKHRTITHSLLFVAALGLLANTFLPAYTLYVVLGIGSHLMLDAMNPQGVPLFHPFNKTKFRFPLVRIPTGGFRETGVLLGCGALAAKLLGWI